MAQSQRGRSIHGLYKPLHGNCAIYFYPGVCICIQVEEFFCSLPCDTLLGAGHGTHPWGLEESGPKKGDLGQNRGKMTREQQQQQPQPQPQPQPTTNNQQPTTNNQQPTTTTTTTAYIYFKSTTVRVSWIWNSRGFGVSNFTLEDRVSPRAPEGCLGYIWGWHFLPVYMGIVWDYVINHEIRIPIN